MSLSDMKSGFRAAALFAAIGTLLSPPIHSQELEDVLRCGGESGTELQMQMEDRKLNYRKWARPLNRDTTHDTAAKILGHFSNDARVKPPWGAEAWKAILDNGLADIRLLKNDSDMGLQSWIRLLYLYGTHPNLPAAAAQQIRDAIARYRYWIDEPYRQTESGQSALPEQVFWSENHQIMYASAEFLAGQLMPAVRFRDGLTGEEHRNKAARRLDQWISHRLHHGFNEWNSPVYYEYTFIALLNLADFSNDERIATRAAMALDLLIFDLARFTQNGSFGTTAGRAYAEHKHAGWRQSVGDVVEILFGTRGRFIYSTSAGAHALASAHRYCVPTALLAIGRDKPARLIDRSRVSVNPGETVGFASDDEAMFWWGKSAFYIEPMIGKTKAMITKYNLGHLLDADELRFMRRYGFEGIVLGSGVARPILEGMALTRANLYTYRDPSVMLSSVQRFRPGQFGPQLHPWQVTFDNEITVFGTYPSARTGGDGPNWWTGTAVNPYIVQRDSAAIIVYSPNPTSVQALTTGHRTHLWFPFGRTDFAGAGDPNNAGLFKVPGMDTGSFAFDEGSVRWERQHASNVDDSVWMFGKRGDGYVGVYSAQPCQPTNSGPWRGKEVICNGLRNAFIVQVGSASTFGSYEQFVRACLGARIHIAKGLLEPLRPFVDVQVSYDSPDPVARQAANGYRLELHYDKDEVRFNGGRFDVQEFPRYDNPYAQVRWGTVRYDIRLHDLLLHHDIQRNVREGMGLKPRQFIGRFDMRFHMRGLMYVVRPNGDVVELIHNMLDDRRTAEDKAQQKANNPAPSLGQRIRDTAVSSPTARIGSTVSSRVEQAQVPQSPGNRSPGVAGSKAIGDRLDTVRTQIQRPIPLPPGQDPPATLSHKLVQGTVARGWQNYTSVLPGERNSYYTITTDNRLELRRHPGYEKAAADWENPVALQTTLPPYKQLISGGAGILYRITDDGTLHWTHQTGGTGPGQTPTLAPWKPVQSNWGQFAHVFSSGEGVLYGIRPDGTLVWHKHAGYFDGSPQWSVPAQISSGWNVCKQAFSTGDGDLYCITEPGELVWYKHRSWQSGKPDLVGPVIIGDAGSVARAFPMLSIPDRPR